jgi:hypothetical protein
VTWSGATPSCLIASQYEILRRAGLGESLPPDARSGLALLLYRGMWGWAQTLLAGNAPRQEPVSIMPHGPMQPSERSSVVQLFAALAMYPHERRAS